MLYGLIALAAMAALGGIYAAGYSAGSSSKQNEWDEASAEQRAKEAEQSNRAATDLETKRTKTRVVYRTITQSVDRVVERAVYRNVCLDPDGLRLAQCAIRGESADTCKPDKPVQPTGATGGRDRSVGAAVDNADG